MAASPFFVIKQGVKWIGMRERDRSYVVSFRSAITARYIQYNMHPELEPSLRRSKAQPAEVQNSQAKHSSDDPRSHISGTQGTVLFLKPAPVIDPALADGSMHIATLGETQLMALPSDRGVGLFIADEIIDEDDATVELLGTIIDPSTQPPRVAALKDLFRR
jgi:hypothetical protein